MSDDLFQQEQSTLADVYMPLAARLRPRHIEEYIGQTHLLAKGKPLREAIDKGILHSMVLCGPPGVGKTSLANLLAKTIDAYFQSLSAVLAGVKDIRAAIDAAKIRRANSGRQTLLFIDEVHRFNKSQQDAFLPFVEDGTITLIGATTENPSFELNNALLSRCRVYVLRHLTQEDIHSLVQMALTDSERGLGHLNLKIQNEALTVLSSAANGDARTALNLLEIASDLVEEKTISKSTLAEVLVNDVRRFDKGGDIFYEQISALHKSVRGSAPDAAIYWFMRMLDGGCDPLYIARRVVRMAVEDIGNADPRALGISLQAWDTQERLGSPEGELAIAQAILYLASAPKSNAVYNAFNQAKADVGKLPDYDVPVHLRNAPTDLMEALDYGADYRYAHDEPDAYAAGENYFPRELAEKRYYFPVGRGLELKIKEKLEYLQNRDKHSERQRYTTEHNNNKG